ncbi:hypothetical protein ACN28E_38735 [Archangium lansingense]|uniref:hypothetical protein n=1 Tax=Archangium lansingense TaxID=2995310 RepID=UPI003B7802A4
MLVLRNLRGGEVSFTLVLEPPLKPELHVSPRPSAPHPVAASRLGGELKGPLTGDGVVPEGGSCSTSRNCT